jgi:hypothetical protein
MTTSTPGSCPVFPTNSVTPTPIGIGSSTNRPTTEYRYFTNEQHNAGASGNLRHSIQSQS